MPVIAHNIASQFTNRQLNITTGKKTKSAEKLSSGYKINRSADDAAGLQISEKMRSQIRGLNQASRNIQDGVSLCQVADGALNETTDILQRMRELSIQSANGTNGESDRHAIQEEIDQLTKEVDRIADTTSFNKEIYPLKENGIFDIINNNGVINNGINNNGVDISPDALKGFLTRGNLKSNPTEYANLSKYVHGTGINQCIDVKVQLNDVTNELELYALDGTQIFRGDCGIGRHPQEFLDKPMVFSNYEAYHKYTFNATLVQPSSYFSSGTFRFEIDIGEDMDINGMNNLLMKSTFTYFVENCELKDIMHRLDDYNFINNSANNSTNNIDSLNVVSNKQIWIQAGANTGEGLFLNLVDATAKGIGITDPNISVMSEKDCDDAMNRLDDAIQMVSSYRSQFGAYQNRLECAKAVDDNTAENTQYAESRIRDTDMAEEMVEHSKNNILEQVGQSMLAQANQSTQGILSLLG